jgi:DNA helicase II / ATP-dependent DNA helicase PcrA
MNPIDIEKAEQPGHLSGLNTQQREAVTTTEGPILILAGAGSGKTRVITYRIVHLIESRGVRPENILAVTFTNKAAAEMKERVDQLLGDKPRLSSPLLSTFHSLCVRILRRNIEKLELGYTRSFTIYDTDDQQSLLRACIKDCGYDDKHLTARQANSAISGAKNRGEDPDVYGSKAAYVDPRRATIAQVYALYEHRMKASNALDFDDLLIRTVQLLRHSEDTRHYYHDRFRHVMVDEFQDTNGIQYSLTRLIVESDLALNLDARPTHFWENRSLCVVGDENQSIYKFRGSDFKIILNFHQDFPGTKTIKLEENYRSTRRILEAANHVISHNKQRFDKILRANAPEGERVRYAQLEDGESEARWVIGKIEEQMRREPGIRAAVLYRTNAQSRAFEEACRRAGLRYNLVGGFSFYERAEVKDIISYLKLSLNPHDSMALMRVINTPARGIGKTTIEEIERRSNVLRLSLWETIETIIEQELLPPRSISALKVFSQIVHQLIAKAQNPAEPISEVVKAAVIDSGYERMLKEEQSEEAEGRLLNLEELVNAAVESEVRGESLSDFLDHAALVADTDDYQADAQVTLMTMHSAKGLEFSLVFIVGMEENLFPHSRASQPEELEEERRLCYVAITRAKQYLYLSHARLRRVYGEQLPSEPSRFLNEFPLDLIEDLSHGRSWLRLAKKASASSSRESQWEPGPRRNMPYDSPKGRGNYRGKTYNDSSGVIEFFARQGKKVDPEVFKSSTGDVEESQRATGATGLKVGMRVRHAKYGQGLIVKREGEGENTKLTINFVGYGHKKMIEKYASLEKV